MRLFGTSGVRRTLSKLPPELVVKLGRAFATFAQGNVGVGRDARMGSELLALALMSGIMYSGSDVMYYGITSTPSALHASKSLGLNTAMVTGSHTPPDIHGVLFFERDTSELHGEHERAVEGIFLKESFREVSWREVGKLSEVSSDPYYLSDLMSLKVSVGELKVVVDGGHSPIVKVLREVFEELGVNYSIYNDEVNGAFPSRGPEPDESSLRHLGKVVREEGADLGISFDGDGDRAIFVDERGEIIYPDYLGVLLALEFGRSGDTVVCPINTSRVVELLMERGIRVVYTRIGPPAIVDALIKENGFFGFEESGKYIWTDNILYGDPLFTLLKLMDLLDSRASSLFEDFPKYVRVKKAYPCPDEEKDYVLKRVIELASSLEGRHSYVDGVRVDFEDGWFLLRPSGTEPLFRLYAEADNHFSLRRLVSLGESLLKEAMK